MNYSIHFPANGVINFDCDPNIKFVHVTDIQANNFNEAFYKAQENEMSYCDLGIRSTTVGDVIVCVETKEIMMVVGMTYKPLTLSMFKTEDSDGG